MGSLKKYVEQLLTMKVVRGRTQLQLDDIMRHLNDVDISPGTPEHDAMIGRIDSVFEHASPREPPVHEPEATYNTYNTYNTTPKIKLPPAKFRPSVRRTRTCGRDGSRRSNLWHRRFLGRCHHI